MANAGLTNTERAAEKRLREAGCKYLVLRWFGTDEKPDIWRLEDGGQAWHGSLRNCLKGLEG